MYHAGHNSKRDNRLLLSPVYSILVNYAMDWCQRDWAPMFVFLTWKYLYWISITMNIPWSMILKYVCLPIYLFSEYLPHHCHSYGNWSWTAYCIIISYCCQHDGVANFNLPCCYIQILHCLLRWLKQS